MKFSQQTDPDNRERVKDIKNIWNTRFITCKWHIIVYVILVIIFGTIVGRMN